jgi:hypothetical protein
MKWMVRYLNGHGLSIFGDCRVALSSLASVLGITKVI